MIYELNINVLITVKKMPNILTMLVCVNKLMLMFVFFLQKYLEGEVLKYKNILKKMKDYDENVSKEQVAKAFAEKERRRLEVSSFNSYLMS